MLKELQGGIKVPEVPEVPQFKTIKLKIDGEFIRLEYNEETKEIIFTF